MPGTALCRWIVPERNFVFKRFSPYRGLFENKAIVMSTVQSLERAIELLRHISVEHETGARLSDLVAASGLPQPTTHRLLKQMVEGGLVMQDEKRRYRLGHFAYELGLLASKHFVLKEQCAPYLQRISSATGDTAFLVVRSGVDSFCLDRQSGSFPIQVLTVDVGRRRPLGIGGGGLRC
ncbi:IclR family transcriptional regulator [Comamonas endophytica]